MEHLEDRLALSAVVPAPVPIPSPTQPPQVQVFQRNRTAPLLVATLCHLGPVSAAAPLTTTSTTVAAGNRLVSKALPVPFLSSGQQPFGTPYIQGGATAISPPTSLSNISGVVFDDLNNDGIRQANERPLAGELVTLEVWIEGDWTPMVTSMTDDNGHYMFSGLSPGLYRLKVGKDRAAKQTGPSITVTGEKDINDVNLGVNKNQSTPPPVREKAPEEKPPVEDGSPNPQGAEALLFPLIDRVFGDHSSKTTASFNVPGIPGSEADTLMVWSFALASPVVEADDLW